MFDLSDVPFFVYVPFLALAFFALIALLTRLCLSCRLSSSNGDSRLRLLLGGRRSHAVPRAAQSTSSVDDPEAHAHQLSATHTTGDNQEPPSYYAGILATSASAYYPMYVPPYNDGPVAGGGSVRDPRMFQGLAGVQAPPPYPPPPEYSQLASIPELPSIVTMRLPTTQTTAIVPSKTDEAIHEPIPPVD